MRSLSARRAWIEINSEATKHDQATSLSARRAWIEIHNHLLRTIPRIVALRKESVDRNYAANAVDQILPGSLSARRAWIEIVMQEIAQQRKQSLSARRAWIEI